MKNKKLKLFILFILLCPSIAFAEATCEQIMNRESYDLIIQVVGYVRIGVPILLLLLTLKDFMTVISSQEEKSINKIGSNVVKRFIAAAAIFFTPLIVELLLGIPAVKNSLGIPDDPFCEGAEFKTEEEFQQEYENTKIKLNRRTLYMEKGQKYQLNVISITKDVTWESNKPDIVKVKQNGEIEAKDSGTAKIIAKSKTSDMYATCTVTVREKIESSSSGGSGKLSSKHEINPDKPEEAAIAHSGIGGKSFGGYYAESNEYFDAASAAGLFGVEADYSTGYILHHNGVPKDGNVKKLIEDCKKRNTYIIFDMKSLGELERLIKDVNDAGMFDKVALQAESVGAFKRIQEVSQKVAGKKIAIVHLIMSTTEMNNLIYNNSSAVNFDAYKEYNVVGTNIQREYAKKEFSKIIKDKGYAVIIFAFSGSDVKKEHAQRAKDLGGNYYMVNYPG